MVANFTFPPPYLDRYYYRKITKLKEGQSGPLSGSGSGPLKVGARALKIKKIIALNVITPMSSGSSCEREAGGQDALLA